MALYRALCRRFQFYDSPIKSFKNARIYTLVRIRFNSMIVRLKELSEYSETTTYPVSIL